MKRFCFLFVLLLLPCALGTYVFDADTNTYYYVDENALDVNGLDANVFSGPVKLRLGFEHNVIGSPSDFNGSGWVFDRERDYSFEVEVPNLSDLYFLDFEREEAFVYVQSVVPAGWHPVMESCAPFGFQIDNLLGEAKPDLFLLSKGDSGVSLEHLEVAIETTVVPNGCEKFFVLIDADAYGTASFGLDVNEFDIGVSINFRKLPSALEIVDRFSMGCSADVSHRCLLIGDQEFDIDNCVDAAYEKNVPLGIGAPLEVCINGPDAYRQWREDTFASKLSAERVARAEAEATGDPELASKVGGLTQQFSDLKNEVVSGRQQSADDFNSLVLFFVVVGVCGLGGFLYKQYSRPMRPLTHYGEAVRKKFEEVKSNVRKEQKEGKGEGSGDGRRGRGGNGQRSGAVDGQEGALHNPVEGGEPVAEEEAGAGGAKAGTREAGSGVRFRWVRRP